LWTKNSKILIILATMPNSKKLFTIILVIINIGLAGIVGNMINLQVNKKLIPNLIKVTANTVENPNLYTDIIEINLSKSSFTSTSSQKTESIQTKKQIKLPIIMYHHIDTLENVNKNDKIAVGLRVSPEVFERQLTYIKDNNYTTITSFDLADYINAKKELPKKPILLTFDDGYKNNYTKALPLLQKYNMKGDFAVITAGINTSDYMTTDDLKDLINKGHSIASHTVSHCTTAIKTGNNIFQDSPVDKIEKPCSRFATQERLTEGQIKFEFQKSKEDLEKSLGTKITHIVFPYGFWNQQAVEIAKSLGYNFATTVAPQKDENIDLDRPFNMPRYRATGQQSGELQGFFAGGR
jgi:peptidoglycan/xylan/chitin deacetylase (PgdA/CDA1 family)